MFFFLRGLREPRYNSRPLAHLYVEWKMLDVDGAGGLEYRRWNPQQFTVAFDHRHRFTMFFQSLISTAVHHTQLSRIVSQLIQQMSTRSVARTDVPMQGS